MSLDMTPCALIWILSVMLFFWCMQGFNQYLRQAEKFGKQPAILPIRQFMCICSHCRTAGKMTKIGGDFRHLPAFKYTLV